MSETSPDPSQDRPFSVRSARPEDADAILGVHHAAIHELGRGFYTDEQVESWAFGLIADRYASAISDGKERFLVAVDAADAVIAFCSFEDDEVKGLYVHPDHARSGIGTALLDRAEATIAAHGHRSIRVRSSLPGKPFYQACGYEVQGALDWKSRGGLPIAVLYMNKTIA